MKKRSKRDYADLLNSHRCEWCEDKEEQAWRLIMRGGPTVGRVIVCNGNWRLKNPAGQVIERFSGMTGYMMEADGVRFSYFVFGLERAKELVLDALWPVEKRGVA